MYGRLQQAGWYSRERRNFSAADKMMVRHATTSPGLIQQSRCVPCRVRRFVLLCRRLDLCDRELLAVDGTRIRQSTKPAVR
jgi:hypothetical protein